MRYEMFGNEINRNLSFSIFDQIINTIGIPEK